MLVKITRAGDGNQQVGKVIELEVFLVLVEMVLKAGGEMPIAVPVP